MKKLIKMIAGAFAIAFLMSVSVFAAGNDEINIDHEGDVVLYLEDAANMQATTLRLSLIVEPVEEANVSFDFSDYSENAKIKEFRYYDKQLVIYLSGSETVIRKLEDGTITNALELGRILVTKNDGTKVAANVSLGETPLEWVHSGTVLVAVEATAADGTENVSLITANGQINGEQSKDPDPDPSTPGTDPSTPGTDPSTPGTDPQTPPESDLLKILRETLFNAESHTAVDFASAEDFETLKEAIGKAKAILDGSVVPENEDAIQAVIQALEDAMAKAESTLPGGGENPSGDSGQGTGSPEAPGDDDDDDTDDDYSDDESDTDESIEASAESASPESSQEASFKSAETGDPAQLALLIALAMVSVMILAAAGLLKMRRSSDEK